MPKIAASDSLIRPSARSICCQIIATAIDEVTTGAKNITR